MKTVNQSQLLEMLAHGAELTSDLMSDEQIAILTTIAEVKEDNATAADIRALKDLLVQVVLQTPPPPVTYQFDVKRDSRDRLVGITATPKKMVKVSH